MASGGSTLFRLTWKRRLTLSGRRICALRALGLRTSGNGCGSWQSPQAADSSGMPRSPEGRVKKDRPTRDPSFLGNARLDLKDQCALASWATPAARDYRSESASDEFNAERWEHTRGKPLSAEATLAPWPTPNTPSGGRSRSDLDSMDATGRTLDGKKHTASLEHAVKFASWPTPNAGPQNDGDTTWETRRETLKAQHKNGNGFGLTLGQAASLGPTSSGSPAETEKPGQLNPAFSLWLMGYGIAWARCAEQVTLSSRRSRRNSSEPI